MSKTIPLLFYLTSQLVLRSPFHAQELPFEQHQLEQAAEQNETEEIDVQDVSEQLHRLMEHPIPLNHATKEILSTLHFLNELQISELLLHKERHGKLLTIYELQSLVYWDMSTIQLLLPYVVVDDRFDQLNLSWNELQKQSQIEWISRSNRTVQLKSGYKGDVPTYNGSPFALYNRLRISYKTNLSLGITMEKDPGEQFFKGNQKQGFDFYSAHAFWKGGKYIRSIAVGDYLVQMGHGLACWTGFGTGKSADFFATKKVAQGIKAYTSSNEVNFFRGGAVQLGYRNWRLLTFISKKNKDARIELDTATNVSTIGSIGSTGFHRTTSEVSSKNKIKEHIIGTHISLQKRQVQLGVGAIHQATNLDHQLKTESYQLFSNQTKSTSLITTDYSFVYQNIHGFGEVAYHVNTRSVAQLHGCYIFLHPSVELAVLYRNYPRDFNSPYGTSFSVNSQLKNERGTFSTLKIKFTKRLILTIYADVFCFNWLKYGVDFPSKGVDYLAQLTYKPYKWLEVYGRMRHQEREENATSHHGGLKEIGNTAQTNIRFNTQIQLNQTITLRNRIEYVKKLTSNQTVKKGNLLSLDIRYQPKMGAFEFTARYGIFDTDDYDSRIYAFENNVLNVSSIPAYYLHGSRSYLIIRYRINRQLDLWVKYGQTVYLNRNSIGTGNEEIKGNKGSEVMVQLRWKRM